MAGLNSLVSDTTNQATTLPTWYDSAQQQLTTGATNAIAQTPGINQTPVGAFAQQLGSSQNPFSQGQTALNQIASGAANPWITDASGNVTPNTNTAMGGLFKAQDQQLNQLLPQYTAPVEAAGIASGQYGSLRGQTAIDKAKADAFANLATQQMQAALQNQSTGSQAASGLGTLGSQAGQTNIATGTFQQNAPFAGLTNAANIINAEKTGSNIAKSTQYSPLSIGTGLLTALGGTSGNAGILGQLFGSTIKDPNTGKIITNSGLFGSGGLSGLFKGSGEAGVSVPGTYPLSSGGSITVNPDGSKFITDASGSVTNYDKDGNPLPNEGYGGDNGVDYNNNTNTGNIDTGTVDTGTVDTGTVDTGNIDTGTVDTGTIDTSEDFG